MPRFMPIEVKLTADSVDKLKREVTFYGAAFGNRDKQGQRIIPGAFAKTIREQLPTGEIKHFRNHEVSIGPMRNLQEDSYGLLCTGYCSKTQAGEEYLEQCLDGSLTHASIYAKVVRDRAHYVIETDPITGEEIETLNLTELILCEAGMVDLNPANTLATLVAVKGLGDANLLDVLHEVEYIANGFALAVDGGTLTAEERRLARSLLGAHASLSKHADTLKALLAPEIGTQPSRVAPPTATPANAETQPDLTMLLKSLQARGRIIL